jgi:hypothetical protein
MSIFDVGDKMRRIKMELSNPRSTRSKESTKHDTLI